MLGALYAIRHKADNRFCYVGQTRLTLEKRMAEHKKGKTPISRLMQDFGVEYFEIVLLEHVTVEQLNEREGWWIHKLNTLAPNGLNCRESGFFNKASEATKKRLSAARKKLWADPEYHARVKQALKNSWNSAERHARASLMFQIKLTPERLAQIRIQNVGRKRSEETKAKLAEISARYWTPENREKQSVRQRGMKASPATKLKMSISRLGKKHSAASRLKISANHRHNRFGVFL